MKGTKSCYPRRMKPRLGACGQSGIEIPAKGCGHETRLRGLGPLWAHCPYDETTLPRSNPHRRRAVMMPFRGIRGAHAPGRGFILRG